MSSRVLMTGTLGVCVVIQSQAWGQQATTAPPREPEPALAEVIVTAQKRYENLQDVPIAVSTLSADQLTTSGIQSTTELGEVTPGLTAVNQNGSILPHIRGVGTTFIGAGIENSVALYVDGVYIAAQDASLLTLNNIAQIEVLKGPQGTLYGRNATGGLINIATKDPQATFSADASLGYGNYQTALGQLYVTGPVVRDLLAADLAVSATTQGEGYGTNLFNGQDVYRTNHDIAVRSKWLFTPDDATTVRLTGDYANTTGTQYSAHQVVPGTTILFGPGTKLGPPAGPAIPTYDIDANFQPHNTFKGGGVSLRVDQDMDFARFTSISAYRSSRQYLAFDADATPTTLQHLEVDLEDRQLTQELQLTSTQSGPLRWVAGAFYLHSDSDENPSSTQFGGPLLRPPFSLPADTTTYSGTKTSSGSIYGQSTLAVTDADHLTLGLRYTDEPRSLYATQVAELPNGSTVYPLAPVHTSPFVAPPPLTQSRRFSATTWRFALDHRFSDAVLAYVSYNRGFKSGGFNATDPTQAPYEPEKLDAFEVGLKTDLWERRLRLDTSAYYYRYKDIQVSNFVAGSIVLYNGAAAVVYGMDLDLKALITPNLTLTAGVAYTHDRYTDFPNAQFYLPNPVLGGNTILTQSADGNRLPITPDATFNLIADYRHPLPAGSLGVNVTYLYSTRYVFTPDNILYQPSYSLVNATLSWTAPGEHFVVSLWGKNLGNKVVADGLISSTIGSLATYQPPRTYGFRMEAKF